MAQLDPNSALAHAGFADTRVLMLSLAYGQRKQNLAATEQGARRALAIDSKLVLPHVSLGYIAAMRDLDTAAAAKSFRRALELEPRSIHVLRAWGDYLTWNNQLDQAHNCSTWRDGSILCRPSSAD